jgi:hypothetical protein
MSDKGRFSKEKQVHAPRITMAIPLAVLFIVAIYLGYLKIIGAEISEWSFFSYCIVVIIVSFIVYLAVNEVLLKMYGGEFKLSRLVFRCALMTSYFSLIYGVSIFLSVLFPWGAVFWQFFFGTLVATAIFLSITWKSRHLFGRLDQGKW